MMSMVQHPCNYHYALNPWAVSLFQTTYLLYSEILVNPPQFVFKEYGGLMSLAD